MFGYNNVYKVEIINNDRTLHKVYIGKNFADAEITWENYQEKLEYELKINLSKWENNGSN